MRRSFEKYMLKNGLIKKRKEIFGLKKYIVGFVCGLFFVGTISYAAPIVNGGTIGGLFEYFKNKIENGYPKSNIYRLDGENIIDKSITNHELADNAIDSRVIQNNSIFGRDIKENTVTEREISDNFIARNSQNSVYLNGKNTESILSGNDNKIPTSKAVRDYIKLLEKQITVLKIKITTLESGKDCKVQSNSYWGPSILTYKHGQKFETSYTKSSGSNEGMDHYYEVKYCVDGVIIKVGEHM